MTDEAEPRRGEGEEGEVAHLTDRLNLTRELDELIEAAQRRRASLQSLLDELLPHLRDRLGARYLALDTRDEGLRERRFEAGVAGQPDHCVSIEVDVAGERLGQLEARFAEPLSAADEARIRELMTTGAEVLDNVLKAIFDSREKHELSRQLHRDLLHPLAEEGIKAAVATLSRAVSFDLLVVVYHQSDAFEQTVRSLIFRDGARLAFDSAEGESEELDAVIRRSRPLSPGSTVMLGRISERLHNIRPEDLRGERQTEKVLRDLGFERYLELMLASGLREATVLGKVVVCSRDELSTFERDLVSTFADALQKRIIDYDRESRQLNRTFSVPTVMRLLRSENYRERWLSPRRREAAVMFTDISGFTRISEQVLREPAKVGAFIQSWGEQVVRLLWERGGACDKFVGDCLIGLFGPPFFDQPPEQLCAAALRTAVAIARATRDFVESEAWAAISDERPELGVATGINFCPASIGSFGLNCGYTAFSSGINNSARLQGVATRDEVLVMESVVTALAGSGEFVFGELREAQVKNVAEPLRFRALIWDE